MSDGVNGVNGGSLLGQLAGLEGASSKDVSNALISAGGAGGLDSTRAATATVALDILKNEDLSGLGMADLDERLESVGQALKNVSHARGGSRGKFRQLVSSVATQTLGRLADRFGGDHPPSVFNGFSRGYQLQKLEKTLHQTADDYQVARELKAYGKIKSELGMSVTRPLGALKQNVTGQVNKAEIGQALSESLLTGASFQDHKELASSLLSIRDFEAKLRGAIESYSGSDDNEDLSRALQLVGKQLDAMRAQIHESLGKKMEEKPSAESLAALLSENVSSSSEQKKDGVKEKQETVEQSSFESRIPFDKKLSESVTEVLKGADKERTKEFLKEYLPNYSQLNRENREEILNAILGKKVEGENISICESFSLSNKDFSKLVIDAFPFSTGTMDETERKSLNLLISDLFDGEGRRELSGNCWRGNTFAVECFKEVSKWLCPSLKEVGKSVLDSPKFKNARSLEDLKNKKLNFIEKRELKKDYRFLLRSLLKKTALEVQKNQPLQDLLKTLAKTLDEGEYLRSDSQEPGVAPLESKLFLTDVLLLRVINPQMITQNGGHERAKVIQFTALNQVCSSCVLGGTGAVAAKNPHLLEVLGKGELFEAEMRSILK